MGESQPGQRWKGKAGVLLHGPDNKREEGRHGRKKNKLWQKVVEDGEVHTHTLVKSAARKKGALRAPTQRQERSCVAFTFEAWVCLSVGWLHERGGLLCQPFPLLSSEVLAVGGH